MKTITLDEMVSRVEETERNTKEPKAAADKFSKLAERLVQIAEDDKCRILTDYDADGICSAYIIQKTLNTLNPNLKTEVICNDRRGVYGVPKNIEGDGSPTIVLDMGSNELDYIRKTFGRDSVIIDHHLVNDEKDTEEFRQNNNLLNLHTLPEEPDYCTTGLAVRLYETVKEEKGLKTSLLTDNGIKIIGGIGTVADMVNLLDANSFNRRIVKEGMKAIEDAAPENTDFFVGYMLEMAGMYDVEPVTANDLAFNVAPLINAASRMSEIIEDNGAQRLYDALSGTGNPRHCGKMLEWARDNNEERKNRINEVIRSLDYCQTLQKERYSDSNLIVYELPEGFPHAFCGLVAGKMGEATDKPIICVVKKTDENGKTFYQGSGRSASGYPSLKEYMDYVRDEMESVGQVLACGGHTDAIGISKISDLDLFRDIILDSSDKFVRKDEELMVLKLSLEEISAPETLEKVMKLEPLGMGNSIPPMIVEGAMTTSTLKNIPVWKRLEVKDDKGGKVSVLDWSYDDNEYLRDAKKNVRFLANLGFSHFKGFHLELQSEWNRQFYDDNKPSKRKNMEISK